MRPHTYESYMEAEILSADPVKLVCLLYNGALSAIDAGRQALAAGDIRGRSQAITKAQKIVNELALSLDHKKGGALSKELVELYDYILRLLLEANTKQVEPPLVEAGSLLRTLLEAWEKCAAAPVSQLARARAYNEAGEYEPISLAG